MQSPDTTAPQVKEVFGPLGWRYDECDYCHTLNAQPGHGGCWGDPSRYCRRCGFLLPRYRKEKP